MRVDFEIPGWILYIIGCLAVIAMMGLMISVLVYFGEESNRDSLQEQGFQAELTGWFTFKTCKVYLEGEKIACYELLNTINDEKRELKELAIQKAAQTVHNKTGVIDKETTIHNKTITRLMTEDECFEDVAIKACKERGLEFADDNQDDFGGDLSFDCWEEGKDERYNPFNSNWDNLRYTKEEIEYCGAMR